jgi:hypothetical protein
MDNCVTMNVGRTPTLGIPIGVPAGILATVTMDVAMVAAARYGGRSFQSDRLGPEVIGRWAAGLLRGRMRHRDIMLEPAQRGELALGIATHYFTGIALTEAFVLLTSDANRRPGFLRAVGYGIATSLLPFLILFPSQGFGWFGSRSGEAARIGRTMVLGHTAFGLGIGLWTPFFARRRRAAPAFGGSRLVQPGP